MELVQTKKWFLRLAITSALLALAFFIVGAMLSSQCSAIIKRKIKTTLDPTIKVDFASCKISLISRSIIFNDVSASFQFDSLSGNRHLFASHKLELKGLDLFQFFAKRKIHVDKTIITDAHLAVDKFLLAKADSLNGVTEKRRSFTGISIDQLDLENCRLSLLNNSSIEFSSIVNVTAGNVNVLENTDHKHAPIRATLGDSSADEIFFSSDDSPYSIRIKRLAFDESGNTVVVDSIRLEPKYGKVEFSRMFRKETDRFELSIPALTIKNIDPGQLHNSAVMATGIHLYSPRLKVYRDKRLPFIKENEVDLPIAQLKQLPFKIRFDTIQLHEGTITYEEFPTDGDSSGSATFHALKASAYNITNYDSVLSDHIDLDVETRFMDSGLLKVSFDFPFNNGECNSAKGSLSDFDLVTLNGLMKPLAKMSIESGHMKSMTFDFSYDEYYSTGEVELNYTDLKILSLTEKQSKTAVDKFKTFLLNTFLIPRKKDETTAAEKRKGNIGVARDPKRSILNYWWKSVFSGVKSSYGLEKGSEVK